MNEYGCYKKKFLLSYFTSKKAALIKGFDFLGSGAYIFLTQRDTVPLISIAVLCPFRRFRKQKQGDVRTFPRARNHSSPEFSLLNSNTKQNQSMKLLS